MEVEKELNQPALSHTVSRSTSHLLGLYPTSRIMKTVDSKQRLCIFAGQARHYPLPSNRAEGV